MYTTTLGTTTCFGPKYWPSSGCPETSQITILLRGIPGCVCVGVGERDLVFIIVGGLPLDIIE